MALWRFSNRNQGVPRYYVDGGTGLDPKEKIRVRRDTDANRLLTLLADGEPFWATDTDLYYVGDGVTLGGVLVSGSAAAAYKVKVTSDDTTGNYLLSKLAAGSNITLTETNPGGNETVTIAATVPTVTGYIVGPGDGVADATDHGIMRWDGTTGRLAQDGLATVDDDGDIYTPGRLAVYGTAIDNTVTAYFKETFSHLAGDRYGVRMFGTHSPGGAGSGSLHGVHSEVYASGMTGAQTGSLRSIWAFAQAGDTDFNGSLFGTYSEAVISTGDPDAGAYGLYGLVRGQSVTNGTSHTGTAGIVQHTGASSLAAAVGILGRVENNNAASTITLAYGGAFAVTKSAGTITTAVGVRIDTPTAGATNYSWQVSEAGGGGDTLSFVVPAMGASWVWTWPTSDGAAYEVLETDGSGNTSWVGRPYDPYYFGAGSPNDAEIVWVARFTRAFSMADDFAGSYATAETGATAEAIYTVYKATGTGAFSSIGTITFAAGGSGGRQAGTLVTSGGTVSVTAGDCLKIVAPATADVTLANVSVGFKGTLQE